MTELLLALAQQNTRSPERQKVIDYQYELRMTKSLRQLYNQNIKEVSPSTQEIAEIILSEDQLSPQKVKFTQDKAIEYLKSMNLNYKPQRPQMRVQFNLSTNDSMSAQSNGFKFGSRHKATKGRITSPSIRSSQKTLFDVDEGEYHNNPYNTKEGVNNRINLALSRQSSHKETQEQLEKRKKDLEAIKPIISLKQEQSKTKNNKSQKPIWSVARKPVTPSGGYVSQPLSPRIQALKQVLDLGRNNIYVQGYNSLMKSKCDDKKQQSSKHIPKEKQPYGRKSSKSPISSPGISKHLRPLFQAKSSCRLPSQRNSHQKTQSLVLNTDQLNQEYSKTEQTPQFQQIKDKKIEFKEEELPKPLTVNLESPNNNHEQNIYSQQQKPTSATLSNQQTNFTTSPILTEKKYQLNKHKNNKWMNGQISRQKQGIKKFAKVLTKQGK